MRELKIQIPEIPHGHGLSFKKGIADALLSTQNNEASCHVTHLASYHKGYEIGEILKTEVGFSVKK